MGELVEQVADVLLVHTWEERRTSKLVRSLDAECGGCDFSGTPVQMANHIAREVVKEVAHELWLDGYDAGADDTRGVQPNYPNRTPSPFSEGGEESG